MCCVLHVQVISYLSCAQLHAFGQNLNILFSVSGVVIFGFFDVMNAFELQSRPHFAHETVVLLFGLKHTVQPVGGVVD